MYTQELACPHCNKRMWANIPDPPAPQTLDYILGGSIARTRCPNCHSNVAVKVGNTGEIKNIFVTEG